MDLKVLFLCLSSCLLATCTNVADMVVSFLILDNKPSSLLTPELCWKQSETKNLARKLFSSNINMADSLQPNGTQNSLHFILILVDVSCPGTESIVLKANNLGYFKSPFRWLILDRNRDGEVWKLMDKLSILVDSDVVIASKLEDEEFLFTEVYKISHSSEVMHATRAVWRPAIIDKGTNNSNVTSDGGATEIVFIKTENVKADEEINTINTKKDIAIDTPRRTIVTSDFGVIEDYRETKVISVRRRDLRGHTLVTANVISDSNETVYHLDDRLNLHQDSITKMSYMMAKTCFDMLNATEKRTFSATWGYVQNGRWNGIISRLMNNEADLGTISIFVKERLEVIDYVAMIGSTTVRFIFREPPLALISNIFTLPFTGTVWLAIFTCVVCCAGFLFITSKWEASLGMHPMQLDGTWADVLILIIGAVLQQGCTLEPRYAAGRCVTLLLFLALTILYAAYSANIVVLLRAPSSSVRSIADLLNSPLKLGASDYPYNRYFFSKLNDPLRKSIYDKKIAPKGKKPNYYSMKEGVEKIRRGLFAFHMESNPGYRLIQETYKESEKCDLVEMDFLNDIDPWMPAPKLSPYKDMFKVNFIKIRESGIQSCIHRRLQVPRPKCSGSISTFSSVGITDMFPAIIATLYGMMLAPAVLCLEIMYKRLMSIREKRKMKHHHFIN